jgi:hypothetical protein
MGFTVSFIDPETKAQTPKTDISYHYNQFRDVFDVLDAKKATGADLVKRLDRALLVLAAKHPIRSSSRDLLKASAGNFEQILNALKADADAHPTWSFHVE